MVGDRVGLTVDGGVNCALADVADMARTMERRGYGGCWTAEVNHDPFLPLALAAEHTTSIELGTGIAVAFARTPMTVANVGWDLQAYSRGRFILGLGSQIQPHIENRFSMPWSHPIRRMREFIAALQAIWTCWRDGDRLQFEGDFYTHKLMTPMFVPEPHEYGFPKVFVAAVGDAMTELSGEVCAGLVGHAFTTRRYLVEVTEPAVQRGLKRAGRDRGQFEMACPVFVVTGSDEGEMAAAAARARKQIAFYASTPAYRRVLELHGWGELQPELRGLSMRGEWDAMAQLIDDAMLAEFAVVAAVHELAAAIRERCAGVIDRVTVGLPPELPEETVKAVLAELHM